MNCRVFNHLGPSGPVSGIVCSRGPRPKKCAHCDHVGTRLCDFPVDFVLAHGPKAGQRVKRTCDAPVCPCHATSIGPDRDLCPPHAKSWERRKAGA